MDFVQYGLGKNPNLLRKYIPVCKSYMLFSFFLPHFNKFSNLFDGLVFASLRILG
jgi:hypothetical protein